jgi:iron complex transport system substrate-binding protein
VAAPPPGASSFVVHRSSFIVHRSSFIVLVAATWLCLSCPGKPKAPTGKVVCLVPSMTEVIFTLGEGRQLSGNTTFCNYPESARMVYKVGDFSNPSVEKIAALKPRLVFATLPEQRSTVDKLAKLGIKVFITRPNSLDSLFEEIRAAGQVLGAQAQAQRLLDSLRGRLNRIPVPSVRPRVYVEISGQPLMSVGRSSFIHEALVRAGGQNLFGDAGKEYPVVSQEEIVRRDPEVIFILHPQATRDEVLQRIGWGNVAAIRDQRVYDDVNPDLLFRSGPRIIEGIEQLAERIQGY